MDITAWHPHDDATVARTSTRVAASVNVTTDRLELSHIGDELIWPISGDELARIKAGC